MVRLASLIVAVAVLTGLVDVAAAVTFQLRNNPLVELSDEAPCLSLAIGGIGATLCANVGVLNTTTGGFGVNHPVSGDTTDEVDGINAAEAIRVVFNVPVTLDQIVLSNFTLPPTGDVATLLIPGRHPITLTPTTPALDVYNFSSIVVDGGQILTLAWTAGNGFSFDSISVTSAPVPEAGSLALVGMGVAALLGSVLRRRRQ